eukprot:6691654-Prymnesium_polylepis.1
MNGSLGLIFEGRAAADLPQRRAQHVNLRGVRRDDGQLVDGEPTAQQLRDRQSCASRLLWIAPRGPHATLEGGVLEAHAAKAERRVGSRPREARRHGTFVSGDAIAQHTSVECRGRELG